MTCDGKPLRAEFCWVRCIGWSKCENSLTLIQVRAEELLQSMGGVHYVSKEVTLSNTWTKNFIGCCAVINRLRPQKKLKILTGSLNESSFWFYSAMWSLSCSRASRVFCSLQMIQNFSSLTSFCSYFDLGKTDLNYVQRHYKYLFSVLYSKTMKLIPSLFPTLYIYFSNSH